MQEEMIALKSDKNTERITYPRDLIGILRMEARRLLGPLVIVALPLVLEVRLFFPCIERPTYDLPTKEDMNKEYS